MKKNFLLLVTAFGITSLPLVAQDSITLIGKLAYTGLPIHDVTLYRDSATNTPYALLCASTSGLRVIDVSNPTIPVQTGTISGGGVNVVDAATWRHYAYTVAENIGATTGRILDLSNPAVPVQVGTYAGAHTVNITSEGYMYLEGPGLRIFDLNANPLSPTLVYNDASCNGHDVTIVGNRLYDFSDNCGTRIYDVSQPDTLILLGTVPYQNIFHHSGYPSEDGNFLFLCDELSSPTENDIFVWDISNLASPTLVDSFIDPNSYVHNIAVEGNYAYVSYYRAGFRVFDVSNPTDIALVDEYDTDSTASGPGYEGNYGIYLNTQDGYILASDETKGLYIFGFSGLTTGMQGVNDSPHHLRVFPNPSTGAFTISHNNVGEPLTVTVTGMVGRVVFRSRYAGGNGTFDVSLPETLGNGVYAVSVGNGVERRNTRVVIER